MRKRLLTWAGGAVVVALLAVWGLGEVVYPHTNPPERYRGTILSPESDALLRQSCFDCHSNETRHPWYRHMPVAGLLMGLHIRSGRDELNFSHWQRMGPEQRREAIGETLESVQEGDMPTLDYRLVHPETRLNAQEMATLERDAQAQYGVRPGEGRGGHGERGERGEHEERD